MRITVTEIGAVESQTKGRNTWQQVVVKYRGDKGDQSRTVRSFEKDVFNAFKQDIKPGDVVDVKVVKDGDYWNWKEATVVEGGSSESDNQTKKSTGTSKLKTGDWETAAERSAKQRYIVRQSSIASAIDYFGHRGFDNVGVSEILNVAETFERHVFGEKGVDKEAVAGGPAKRGRPRKETNEEEQEVE